MLDGHSARQEMLHYQLMGPTLIVEALVVVNLVNVKFIKSSLVCNYVRLDGYLIIL